jgi:hypothetical protein
VQALLVPARAQDMHAADITFASLRNTKHPAIRQRPKTVSMFGSNW